jgi:hypothetical protein
MAATRRPQIRTDWEPYTPTFQGFGTVINIDMNWRRVGSIMEIQGRFTLGTVSGSEIQIGLANGGAVGDQISANPFGVGRIYRGAVHTDLYNALATQGDTFLNVSIQSSGGELAPIGGTAFSSGNSVGIQAWVPIQGWS